MGSASSPIRRCDRCTHRHLRAAPILFNSTSLQSAAVLGSQAKWDEEQRQRAKEEMQRVLSGTPFLFEPHHYAWCDSFSQVDRVLAADPDDDDDVRSLLDAGAASFDPVRGKLLPIYHICDLLNSKGQCERYDPRA